MATTVVRKNRGSRFANWRDGMKRATQKSLALLCGAAVGPLPATAVTTGLFGWTTSCVIAAAGILAMAIGRSRSTEQVLVRRLSARPPSVVVE